MKLRLLLKVLLIEIILGSQITLNQITTREFCFGYFCKFVTHTLTLRLRNRYIYIRFLSVICFFNFYATFCFFLETKNKFTRLYTKFWVKLVKFVASNNVLVCCCVPNQYSKIFSKISNQSMRFKGKAVASVMRYFASSKFSVHNFLAL